MISRLEWMIKHGREGVRLGIIQIDWAVKYDAYLTYLEFYESLKNENFKGKKSRRSQAILLTADKLRIGQSTVWRYLAAFDYVSPTPEEMKYIKAEKRWAFSNS